jgi:hypothetical protein
MTKVNVMAIDANRLKAEQLGMPFGTACGKLRKLIVFDLLKQLGKNVCYRCEQPIEDAVQLSIEHKVAWLHNDPNLFWDLDNIAFSHLTCNCKASKRTNKKYSNVKERKRVNFTKMYADPIKRRNWLDVRNKRRTAS